MDVRLQNAYVEVLLGNFMEVVKQNLLFQAQIEVNKNSLHEADDSVRRLKEISDSNAEYQKQSGEKDNKINHLENRINQLITERDNLKSSSENNNSLKLLLETVKYFRIKGWNRTQSEKKRNWCVKRFSP